MSRCKISYIVKYVIA